MGKFMKGDVVVAPFPFSDLTAAKRRPALVIASLTGDDVILCQITSKSVSDSYAIPITKTDFASGGLPSGQQHPSKSPLYSRRQHHRVPCWRIDLEESTRSCGEDRPDCKRVTVSCCPRRFPVPANHRRARGWRV
jgi:hypothetical protein